MSGGTDNYMCSTGLDKELKGVPSCTILGPFWL